MDLWAQCGPMKSILDQFDRLYAFGRDALYWGLREYASGEASCVWMPSYHCGVEVQAALDAGFEVCFYRVRSDLTIDESDLEAKVSVRPGHVMVIHYMGFVQPGSRRIASLCARLGVMLIEDCTHALLSSFDGERADCNIRITCKISIDLKGEKKRSDYKRRTVIGLRVVINLVDERGQTVRNNNFLKKSP